jgi:anti-sigma-K factor RskA
MNIQHNEPLREKLSAEYVLGTLIGGARRRFEQWLRDDAALRRTVTEWQDRLNPMAEFAPSVQPSPKVWESLVRRLNLNAKPSSDRLDFWRGLREDLSFWRGLGMASTLAALFLVSILMTRPTAVDAPVTSFVAVLADANAQSIAVATGDAKTHQMTLKLVKPQTVAADRSLELWAINKEGKVRSLGLIDGNGTVTTTMTAEVTPTAAPVLAVTLEPKGGSGNPNAATGPIVFKGEWVKI